MTSKIANLVQQKTTGTGTGELVLTSVYGKRDFSAAFGSESDAEEFYYFISHQAAAQWEHGTGVMADDTTLVRSAVISSSNANNPVNFSAGIKDVINSPPADLLAQLEDLAADLAALAAPKYRQVTEAGGVTLGVNDWLLGINKDAGANTDVTLSDAAGVVNGRLYEIKDEMGDAGTHRIRLIPQSGVIEGAAYYDIAVNRGYACTYHNGTEWKLK